MGLHPNKLITAENTVSKMHLLHQTYQTSPLNLAYLKPAQNTYISLYLFSLY